MHPTSDRRLVRRIARVATWFAIALASIVLLMLLLLAILWACLPSVDDLATRTPARTAYMVKRARSLGLRPDAYSARFVPLERISPILVCAVVKAEDGSFFSHRGLDWGQTRKAFFGWLRGRHSPGGSTITQQLARNLHLGPERTAWRKLREAVLARKLERALDKTRILELYLNLVEWGDGSWGIDAAARLWFAKIPAELDAFEATFLAAILPSPRRPLDGNGATRTYRVQRRVLWQLFLSGILDGDELAVSLQRAELLRDAARSASPREAIQRARAMIDRPATKPHRFMADAVPPDQAIAASCGELRLRQEISLHRRQNVQLRATRPIEP